MKTFTFLVVLLALFAFSHLASARPAQKGSIMGGFGKIKHIKQDTKVWHLAMLTESMNIPEEDPIEFPYFHPYEYAVQTLEGPNYAFKIEIDPYHEECLFLEVYHYPTPDDEFVLYLNKKVYDMCYVNLLDAI